MILLGPLIMLLFLSHLVSGATSTLITLIVDCHVDRPATASSANNLFRCCFGAGAVAAAVPLINSIGIGWTSTLIGFIWVSFSPVLWGVYFWGHDYRKAKEACQFECRIQGNIYLLGWESSKESQIHL